MTHTATDWRTPRPGDVDTLRAYGLGHARVLASVRITRAQTPDDAAFWRAVLDTLDAPASGAPTTPQES